MPKRQRFQSRTHYHVYNRGRKKQTLFHNNKDFERFLWYIKTYEEKCKHDIKIIAYALLPNHFHMVIYDKKGGYRTSYFVGTICAAYTKYYSKKYGSERGVSFFESRFKAKEIGDEEYLKTCMQYVERNAVKHGFVENPEERIFTSYDKCKIQEKAGQLLLNLDWEF